MLRSPRYGLPPPPVPRIHAPTARDSMSSRVSSRVFVIASSCKTVGASFEASLREAPQDEERGQMAFLSFLILRWPPSGPRRTHRGPIQPLSSRPLDLHAGEERQQRVGAHRDDGLVVERDQGG